MVKLEFVNKEGKKRRVRFPIEKQSYEVYHHPSVSQEWRDRMMLESYREFCAQKKFERMTCQFPVDEEGNEVEFPDPSKTPNQLFDEAEERRSRVAFIESGLWKMPDRQRQAFALVHLEGLTKAEAMRAMNLKWGNFSKRLKKAEKKFEIYLKERKK